MGIEKLYDANVLYRAFRETIRESYWKESVQRYEINYLRNIAKTISDLKSGDYRQKEFNEFILCDRGKSRYIKAVSIWDRVVLRALCDCYIDDVVRRKAIYDNGASVKGKGIDFTRKRLEEHLHRYYRKHGNQGYVLKIDFTKFFDNIPHEKLMEVLRKDIDDDEVADLIETFIKAFKVDVSYMDEEEFSRCMNEVFDSVEYAEIDPKNFAGEKFMKKSLGIGSQISQSAGLLYPSRIDNYCKIVRQCRYYGRYMDDIYIIHESKEFLQDILTDIRGICDELGIFINDRKTGVTKLSRGFGFLKARYYLTDTGKVIRKIDSSTITRTRRKLKKFRKLYDQKRMDIHDIYCSYMSMRANIEKFDSYMSMKNLDRLFCELFGDIINKEIRKNGMSGFARIGRIGLKIDSGGDKNESKRINDRNTAVSDKYSNYGSYGSGKLYRAENKKQIRGKGQYGNEEKGS